MLLKEMYTQLKQELSENYTIEDVESLGRQEVITLLGDDDFTETVLKNAKKMLLRDINIKKKEDNMLEIDNKIKAKFPNAEYDSGAIDGKEFVVVWLEGKPEEVNI
jgi:hypothetical protein